MEDGGQYGARPENIGEEISWIDESPLQTLISSGWEETGHVKEDQETTKLGKRLTI